MLLVELFDKTIPYEIESDSSNDATFYRGYFDIGLLSYFVNVDVYEYGYSASIAFSMVDYDGNFEHSEDITGTGNEFAVFSTVIAIVKEVLKVESKLKIIKFTAKEPSRIKMYRTLANHLTKNTDWKITEESRELNTHFVLKRS